MKQFMKAGRVSADAVASVSQELREAELGDRQFENFDTVMQSHMQTLLFPQGSASSGLSKTSQKRLQRTKQKEDYAVALDACKLLVADYEANECGVATEPGLAVSIGLWQSAIGNQRFQRTLPQYIVAGAI